MQQSRRTRSSLTRWIVLLTLFFVVSGPAAHAVWYPTYSNGTYMGCTHIPDLFEPGYPATYNMSYFGCVMMYIGDSLRTKRMGGREVPTTPPGWTLEDAGDLLEQAGFESDSDVQAGMAGNAAELRRIALGLQAAALDLMATAQEAEGLATAEELEGWAAEALEPPAAPVCDSPLP